MPPWPRGRGDGLLNRGTQVRILPGVLEDQVTGRSQRVIVQILGRWPSGLRRRFAKPVWIERFTAGSNPARSANLTGCSSSPEDALEGRSGRTTTGFDSHCNPPWNGDRAA